MAKVTEFYEAAIVLANAEMVDSMMRLWLGFHADNDWVAALSVEERADFLNFPDSISTTVLSDVNDPTGPSWHSDDTELEPEEAPIPNPNPEADPGYGVRLDDIINPRPKSYDFDEASFLLVETTGDWCLKHGMWTNDCQCDPRHNDHVAQVWTGRP